MALERLLSPAELTAAMEERAAYGLPADTTSIEKALGIGVERGMSQWGMVVTDDELTKLDLEGRIAFESQAEQGVLAFAESLPGYAGAYFDQTGNGSLTILLTNEVGADEIERLAPPGDRPVKVLPASHTYEDLTAAVDRLVKEWPSVYPTIELMGVAIDPRSNGLQAHVQASDLAAGWERIQELANLTGVAVHLASGQKEVLMSCTDRHHCTDPMRAGDWIYSSTGEYCALGFWVRTQSGDERMVTAGHCSGQNGPPGTLEGWYHQGYGYLGSEISGQNWYYSLNHDVMVVQGPDSQAGNRVYGESRTIRALDVPYTGESVCASLTKSNHVDCGTVTGALQWYVVNGYGLWGAGFSGISIIGGDSGSPVYHYDPGTTVTMFGVISTGNHFALPAKVLPQIGYTPVT